MYNNPRVFRKYIFTEIIMLGDTEIRREIAKNITLDKVDRGEAYSSSVAENVIKNEFNDE